MEESRRNLIHRLVNRRRRFSTSLWPSASDAKPAATITVASDGKALAALHLNAPTPDSNGAYRFAGRIPLASFAPSQYELMVTIGQGATASLDQALFNVQ